MATGITSLVDKHPSDSPLGSLKFLTHSIISHEGLSHTIPTSYLHFHLQKRNDICTCKPIPLQLIYSLYCSASLIWSSGEPWRELRRLGLRSLRTFGMGKKSLEPQINLEARYLCEELESSKGLPQHIQSTLHKASANIISQLEYNRRYDYNDQEYRLVVGAMSGATSALSNTDPATICPLLLKTPLYKQFRKDNRIVKEFILTHVYSHKDSLKADDIRDITDAFLADISTKFSLDGFSRILRELFLAGTETVSTFLSWSFLFLAVYPDKQKKVRKVISFGTNNLVRRMM